MSNDYYLPCNLEGCTREPGEVCIHCYDEQWEARKKAERERDKALEEVAKLTHELRSMIKGFERCVDERDDARQKLDDPAFGTEDDFQPGIKDK